MNKQEEQTMKKTIILEELECAHCAAKMEKKINELPEVEAATITFATKQLRVASEHHEHLLPVLQEICASVESEVVVRVHREKPSIRDLPSELTVILAYRRRRFKEARLF